MKIIGVIPARYKSSRYPGKPLVELLGKPMIIWVAELSAIALGKENIYIATDDYQIKTKVEEYGFKVIITSEDHQTGTDRLSEIASKIFADIYINIQGDEPTVDPKVINDILKTKIANPDMVINAMAKLTTDEDPKNINIPKVIFNENNLLVYMSRLPIPGYKSDINKPVNYYKQVCIYAFSHKELTKYGEFSRKSKLERCEDIEILRFLELGIPIKMLEVNSGSLAVDVIEDVPGVEQRLREIHKIK